MTEFFDWKKDADRERTSKWRGNNREKANAYSRITRAKWKAENPEAFEKYRRKTFLKMTFNITPEQWDIMFTSQGNSCAICKTTTPGGHGKWHTDHVKDSKPAIIRGILCHRCNLGQGLFSHDPVKLRAAAEYLEEASE